MIKAIVSDYDGVLIPDEYRGTRSFCPDTAKLEALESPYYSKADSSGLWAELRTQLNLTLTNEECIRAYNTEDKEQLRQEAMVLDVYRRLKPALKGLFLLSNQITDRANFLRQKSALSLFDQLYFSNELGRQKPDTRIFQIILTEHGLRPADVLFIDDTAENTEAAKSIGLQTVLFAGTHSLDEIVWYFNR